MPSSNLKKSEKNEALLEMVKAKFKHRHDKLMERRSSIAIDIYNDTFGKIGNILERTAGEKYSYWLDTTGYLKIPDIPVPCLIIYSGSRSKGDIDFFTQKSYRNVYPETFNQSLVRDVVKPDREYEFKVYAKDSLSKTKKAAQKLAKDINEFNDEITKFYREASYILCHIRTTKQADEMMPELWEFLPDGLRESIKQAVVVVDQNRVDAVREEVVGLSKLR